jgi:soluble lytic murein transglycosylase
MRRVGAVVVALAVVSSLGGAGDAGEAAAPPWPAELTRYAEAHGALAAGEYERALAGFEGLPADFLLADYAVFFAAESLLRAGHDARALERFRAFPDQFPTSTLIPPALLAAADTAFRLGRWADAEREARRLLARAPAHPEAGRVLVRLAEAHAAQGRVAEALSELKRRWIEAPASLWGEAARELMEALASQHGLPVPPLSGEEQFLRAQRLLDASEVAAAARALEELLAQGPDAELRHRALLRLGPALGRLQRGPEAIALLEAALVEPPGLWQPALLYELARLYRRVGQAVAAVPILERLLAASPSAPVIPDAWLTLGRTRLELGRRDEARATFQELTRAHPDHPVAAAAGWELAWLDYRAGRFRDAALAFRQLATTAPPYRLAALYWAGRALEALRESSAARALYRDVVSRSPHSYYGILGLRRLSGPVPAPVAAPVRLPADPLAGLEREVAVRKGRALWRLGFEGHALLEFESLGRDGVLEPERAYGLGALFAQLGEPGRSLRYLRRAFGALAEAGAPGLTPAFWRLLYPFGYAEIVREAARRAGLDPFLLAAVIREESSYDPRARSWVGAVGLMQLMPDTARLAAAEAGIRFAESAGLWEPPVNITLGAHYLAQLQTRFREPLFAVASYNAGPHRVQRWLAERRTADPEEFIDQIPFDETRAFVKRVYASWHQYRRLYGIEERPRRRGEAEALPRRGR